MTERTLSILKPDAVAKNNIGAVEQMLENEGLKVVAMKMLQITEDQAGEFYRDHKGKHFFEKLVGVMVAGPVIVQVLEGEGAILKNRNIMGDKNPELAEEGTIRKIYGESLDSNTVHGSDSPESAVREIAVFFNEDEIFSR